MEKNKDYEKRLGIRLREAYLKDYEGPAMSREEFHRLVEAAEKKKKHKRTLIGIAAACVALCLVCGGFVAGISMRESASAGKDDETKTVQQGGSVVIGDGVSENDQNVGVSVKTYTDIGDIPEDLREQIRFLDSDEFELEKVKVVESSSIKLISVIYEDTAKNIIGVDIENVVGKRESTFVVVDADEIIEYGGYEVFCKNVGSVSMYRFCVDDCKYLVSVPITTGVKIEVLLEDLLN